MAKRRHIRNIPKEIQTNGSDASKKNQGLSSRLGKRRQNLKETCTRKPAPQMNQGHVVKPIQTKVFIYQYRKGYSLKPPKEVYIPSLPYPHDTTRQDQSPKQPRILGGQQPTTQGNTETSLRTNARGREDVIKHFNKIPSTDAKGHQAWHRSQP
ncbi:hypothetical protein A2U01_0035309 [Trifolium medium]|uniref:Uncharacterized protein n=1 Tax=Trifolium medium TaxID=97028 RepID=A0A392PR46_9FABA|nr:hypothetical protein [Trifolium medium]